MTTMLTRNQYIGIAVSSTIRNAAVMVHASS